MNSTAGIKLMLDKPGLYVHLPWCVRKCPYCDFNSYERDPVVAEDEYVRALLMDLDCDLDAWGAIEFASVFIGGGTPNIQKNIIAERILGLPKD